MDFVTVAASTIGMAAACNALGLPRATFYRHKDGRPAPVVARSVPRQSPERALSPEQRQQVLDVLHCERFVDQAPGEVQAILLDEGTYLCSDAYSGEADHPVRRKPITESGPRRSSNPEQADRSFRRKPITPPERSDAASC